MLRVAAAERASPMWAVDLIDVPMGRRGLPAIINFEAR